ncbi:MAG: glutamate--tRNA ligase [Alphaproteobacteria bacterium]|nr:glutamate--tRNA ligase [Alphaproteobacteria bacterium]
MEKVRVRFAPSPTGMLHVGNIKIALLNYIFAKKYNGKLILRIDDTDLERSTKESEKQILDDLEWLGIKYDEFYRQSERIEKYQYFFEKLKSEERVYPCYETKEELALKRKTQTMSGIPPVYDRSALQLTDEQRNSLERAGNKPYWRFKLNENSISKWHDLLHGDIHIPLNTVSDPVIVKPDGGFVYTFASVVDDADIGITHIIRGDDHVTNTATQIDIFNAIYGKNPEFAHVPLMSTIDNQEVSKRTGSDLSIVNMHKAGILPEAIIEVLMSIGTSNNIDIHDTIESLIDKFSFDKMSLASPKFNIEDVKSVSRKILAERNFNQVKNEIEKIWGNRKKLSDEKMSLFWDTIKGNIDRISDITTWFEALFEANKFPESSETISKQFIEQMLQSLPNDANFDSWIKKLKEISGKKGRDLFHPIRIVLTGIENGPELRKITELLGYDNIRLKIEKYIKNQIEK